MEKALHIDKSGSTVYGISFTATLISLQLVYVNKTAIVEMLHFLRKENCHRDFFKAHSATIAVCFEALKYKGKLESIL